MANTIYEVADWFLSQEPMSHKKLQKLCYYAKAWGLALLDEDIMPGYDFEAWVHGPVNPELYRKYKGNFWMDLASLPDNSEKFSKKILDLLRSVWETYKELSANEIEVRTHLEPPWIKARHGLGEWASSHAKIKAKDMKDYYRSVYTGV